MVATDVEATVAFQMDNLMYLKIKTDSFHCLLFFKVGSIKPIWRQKD